MNLRNKQKMVDFNTHLASSAITFKENLKVIVGMIIENVWAERMQAKNFQEIINKVRADIWRGPFDQINEVDEELRSSRFYSNRVGESQLVRPSLVVIEEVDTQREEGGNNQLSSIKNALMANSQIIELEEHAGRDSRKAHVVEDSSAHGPSKGPSGAIEDAPDSENLNPLNTFKKTIPMDPESGVQGDGAQKRVQGRSSSQPVEARGKEEELPDVRTRLVTQVERAKNVRALRSDYFGSFNALDQSEAGAIQFPVSGGPPLSSDKPDNKWFSSQLGSQDPCSSQSNSNRGQPGERKSANNLKFSVLANQTTRKDPVYRSIFRSNVPPNPQKKALDRSGGLLGTNLGQPTLRVPKKAPLERP